MVQRTNNSLDRRGFFRLLAWFGGLLGVASGSGRVLLAADRAARAPASTPTPKLPPFDGPNVTAFYSNQKARPNFARLADEAMRDLPAFLNRHFALTEEQQAFFASRDYRARAGAMRQFIQTVKTETVDWAKSAGSKVAPGVTEPILAAIPKPGGPGGGGGGPCTCNAPQTPTYVRCSLFGLEIEFCWCSDPDDD